MRRLSLALLLLSSFALPFGSALAAGYAGAPAFAAKGCACTSCTCKSCKCKPEKGKCKCDPGCCTQTTGCGCGQ